eukprot:jgi/Tetstr1/463695/TSEL_008556.t1
MAQDNPAALEASSQLPRVLDLRQFVEARQAELDALSSAIKASGKPWGQTALPRHLRRRATSHRPHKTRRRPNEVLAAKRRRIEAPAAGEEAAPREAGAGRLAVAADESAAADATGVSSDGALRRREPWQREWLRRGAAEGDSLPAEGSTRQLETHVWHAKRMEMVTLWGHMLALGAPGRGRGRKAIAHRLSAGGVLHDASYHLPLLLRGPLLELRAVLGAVSDPQGGPARDPLAEQPIMLHEPSKWPAGAIGPARLAWLPMPADRLSAAAPGGGDGACLLWLHCSACDAGEAALLAAAAGTGVSVQRQRAHLRRLEVRGGRAGELLARVLRKCASGGSGSALCRLAEEVEAAGAAPSVEAGAAFAVRLPDPRAPGQEVTAATSSAAVVGELLAGGSAPPQPEAAVSRSRQLARRKSLHLSTEPAAASHAAPPPSACPAILVKRAAAPGCGGWSLILPAGWVRVFWQELVMSGLHAVGLREWEWVAEAAGVAAFPRDYPDTDAGAAAATARGQAAGSALLLPRTDSWQVLRSAAALRLLHPAGAPVWRHPQPAAAAGAEPPAPCTLAWRAVAPTRAGPPAAHLRALLQPLGKGRPLAGARIAAPSGSPARTGDLGDLGVATADGCGGVGSRGASCLCRASALWRLRSQQGAATWTAGGAIYVAYLNPRSDTWRRGRLRVCLEAAAHDCDLW